MIKFTFIDKSNEKYGISFGWRFPNTCTICVYPNKWNNQSLAMCSFPHNNKLIIDNEEWAKEFLSLEIIDFVNKLLKNKVYW